MLNSLFDFQKFMSQSMKNRKRSESIPQDEFVLLSQRKYNQFLLSKYASMIFKTCYSLLTLKS